MGFSTKRSRLAGHATTDARQVGCLPLLCSSSLSKVAGAIRAASRINIGHTRSFAVTELSTWLSPLLLTESSVYTMNQTHSLRRNICEKVSEKGFQFQDRLCVCCVLCYTVTCTVNCVIETGL